MEGIQEITLFILRQRIFCPILLRAFDLPPGKGSPVKSHIPLRDSCCQEAFHDFWPICFSGDFQHDRPSLLSSDVWLEIWDWTKEEMVGKSHGAVHIPTATNDSECWREVNSQAGNIIWKPRPAPEGKACVTYWKRRLSGVKRDFRILLKDPLPGTSPKPLS